MDTITDKIKSLRESVGVSYSVPPPEKLSLYIANLLNTRHPQAMSYIKDIRGLTDETIKHFKLGFDIERNAIAIPIFKNGALINFKYRLLDGETRYTSESNCETWMFNDDAIPYCQKRGAVLIVEGEFDCMRVWQTGIHNVVSPAAGKDSFGPWLELIDGLKRIYIGYDNDEGGKSSALKMAERLGVDRCFEVTYPDVKDASDYLAASPNGLRDLLKAAKPFTSRQFKSLGDIISSLREGDKKEVITRYIPKVGFQKGWMAIISARTNVGKTAFVLNIADELTKNGVGVLVLPFERGIESVGERFLNIMSGVPSKDFASFGLSKWTELTEEAAKRPLYFAMPSKEQATDFMLKSHRYFDTKVVIIDHLDYMVRQVGSNRGDAIADTLQQLKKVAEDNGLILLVVSHIRKTEAAGQFIAKHKKPNIEDLKGSSALYQDPEVVVMLSQTMNDNEIYVDVLKNKGEMSSSLLSFDASTGKLEPLEAFNGADIWNAIPDQI